MISKGIMKIKCDQSPLSTIMMLMIMITISTVTMLGGTEAGDTNDVYDPCSDSKVEKFDGFTFGIAFSAKENFFLNETQLSPCDKRLSLAEKSVPLAVFRPKVDEISLLSIDSNAFDPAVSGGYMVAFAGRKYAARSQPELVADQTHTITSFTLVLEFQGGTLQNLHWKKSGCEKCKGVTSVCLNNQDCAIPNSKCKGRAEGGTYDCSLSIQLVFSGTDKNLDALNSWYELKNLRQNSLFRLFSGVKDSLMGKYDSFF